MKIVIQGQDYSAALDSSRPITITRTLNEPGVCTLGLSLPAGPGCARAVAAGNYYGRQRHGVLYRVRCGHADAGVRGTGDGRSALPLCGGGSERRDSAGPGADGAGEGREQCDGGRAGGIAGGAHGIGGVEHGGANAGGAGGEFRAGAGGAVQQSAGQVASRVRAAYRAQSGGAGVDDDSCGGASAERERRQPDAPEPDADRRR